MTEIPVVSVIMLIYNQKNTFSRAVESVLCQKCSFPIEILIGDDASTDGSSELIAEYAKKYSIIRPFFREENLGVTRNAYELLLQAKGKYIASCEGDDYWCDDEKLKKQVEFLDAHEEYVGCSHDVDMVTPEGVVFSRKNPTWVSNKKEYGYKDFKGIFLPGQSGSIVKRNIFTAENLSLLYKASSNIGDRTTVLLCLPYGKFYHMKEHMACYTVAMDKKSASITQKNRNDPAAARRKEWEYTKTLEEYAEKNAIPVSFEWYKRKTFCSSILAVLFFKEKDRALPREILDAADNKLVYIFALLPLLVVKLWHKFRYTCLKWRYSRIRKKRNGRL